MAEKTESETKPKDDSPKAEKGSKSDVILNAILDHVTRNGSEADDALRAKVYKLSGGKVGGAAKGTVDATEQDDGRHVE